MLALLWSGSGVFGLIGVLEVVALVALRSYDGQGFTRFAEEQAAKHGFGAMILLASAFALGVAGNALKNGRSKIYAVAICGFLAFVGLNILAARWWPSVMLPGRGTTGEALSFGLELIFVGGCALSLLLVRVPALWPAAKPNQG